MNASNLIYLQFTQEEAAWIDAVADVVSAL